MVFLGWPESPVLADLWVSTTDSWVLASLCSEWSDSDMAAGVTAAARTEEEDERI